MKNTEKILNILGHKIGQLKNTIAVQREELSRAETQSIHSMEVAQKIRVEDESLRRDQMNDGDLRLDLEKQYGTTGWATRLINEMLTIRIRARKAKSDVVSGKVRGGSRFFSA